MKHSWCFDLCPPSPNQHQFDDSERQYLITSDNSHIWPFGFGAPVIFFPFLFLREFTGNFRFFEIFPFLLPSLRLSAPEVSDRAFSSLKASLTFMAELWRDRGEKAKEKKVSSLFWAPPNLFWFSRRGRERGTLSERHTGKREELWSDSHCTDAAAHFVTLSVASLLSILLGSPELHHLERSVSNFSQVPCDLHWNDDWKGVFRFIDTGKDHPKKTLETKEKELITQVVY